MESNRKAVSDTEAAGAYPRKPGRRAAACLVVIASVGAVGVAGAFPAAAGTVQRELHFTCSSSYGPTSMTAVIKANAPDSAVAGRKVPGIILNLTATESLGASGDDEALPLLYQNRQYWSINSRSFPITRQSKFHFCDVVKSLFISFISLAPTR